MTIRLLTDWPYKRASNAGYVTIPAGSIVSVFDAATETGMIAAKVAAASAAAVTWTPPSDAPIYTELLPAEVAATRSLVSGDRTPVASSRDITADDNGKFLAPAATLTLTIPAGLDPMPSFTVDCPASGTVSIARSTTATINGAGTTLTRTRANNPVGFVVLAHEPDAYGVSGA